MTVESVKIADLSASAAPMTTQCKQDGAVCDTSVGLCLGGPSFAPTSEPTPSPTFYEACPDPYRHAASDVCPNPVGGAMTEYDTTDISKWEIIDQEPISEPCLWTADATGLTQSSPAWGTAPTNQAMIGCLAMIPDSYTDFIAEIDTDHFDNDAWGFVFGYNGALDHYGALTHNDAWPLGATDGIPGPYTKLRKTTGTPCFSGMNASTACYTTLAYTDANGFSDVGAVRGNERRSKEYEYSHVYSGNAVFQPHKLTLIVQGQEARLLYKSPDTPGPNGGTRQGNRYQAAFSYDLQGYTGGRIGVMTGGHMMLVKSMKVWDISDPSNMPTAYCGGDAGAVCDAGATGVCLAVAAPGICEKAVNPVEYDTSYLDQFEFIDDPLGNRACQWGVSTPGPPGNSFTGAAGTELLGGYLYQSSFANRIDGTMLGCNAMLADVEYTDFVMEMTMNSIDDDGIGFTFGWKSLDDHWRVHKINDIYPDTLADGVQMPHMKIRRKIPGVSCDDIQTPDSNCYETVAYIDSWGPMHSDMPADAVTPAGECGYSQTYLPVSLIFYFLNCRALKTL